MQPVGSVFDAIWLKRARVFLPFATIVVGAYTLAAVPPGITDALTGFDNQTNEFTSQVQFDEDRDAFDETEVVKPDPENDQKGGLGPVYNDTSCVACHQNSGVVNKTANQTSEPVSGSSSQVSEIRAGHNEKCVKQCLPFVPPGTIVFREAPGGSVIQQRAIDPRVQERVPEAENIRTLRMATSVLGGGYVEAIPDLAIVQVFLDQLANNPQQAGMLNIVPVAVAPAPPGSDAAFIFESRVGRFGWKAQEASLLNFSAGAYVTEMGITSPLQRVENSSLGTSVSFVDLVTPEPEDKAVPGHPFGEDVEAFTRFMRSTKAPPQAAPKKPPNVVEGEKLFTKIGCAVCHVPEFVTMRVGRYGDIDAVPPALAWKRIRPYSDFLLHDIGTGDGIVQAQRAELPPTGLTLTSVSADKMTVRVNVERLNELLRGNPDPHPAAREFNQRLQLQSEKLGIKSLTAALRELKIPPAVQVADIQLPGKLPIIVPGMAFTRETANMIRTAPLWGLRTRPQLLHDGSALTVRDAINRHQNQGAEAQGKFVNLPPADQERVLVFLNFL
jgi:CxxC motif-containing protein (DUF1111 family)